MASSAPSASGNHGAAAAAPAPIPSLLLHHATFRNDVAELQRLLDLKKYDVDCCDAYGNTALHLAVMLRHSLCTTLLLQHGVDVGIKNRDGWSALHEATSIGDRDTLRALWVAYKAKQDKLQELSGLLSHLKALPDFRQSSIVMQL
jgi:ankyrin repeat protein